MPNPSEIIPIGGEIDLIFSVISVKTGNPVPNATISNQSVTLSDNTVADFVQDASNPNIFHFTGIKSGTIQINCQANVSL